MKLDSIITIRTLDVWKNACRKLSNLNCCSSGRRNIVRVRYSYNRRDPEIRQLLNEAAEGSEQDSVTKYKVMRNEMQHQTCHEIDGQRKMKLPKSADQTVLACLTKKKRKKGVN